MTGKRFPHTGIDPAAWHSAGPGIPVYTTPAFTYDIPRQGMERFAGKDKGRRYTRWSTPVFTANGQAAEALEVFGIEPENGETLTLKPILHPGGQAGMTTFYSIRYNIYIILNGN